MNRNDHAQVMRSLSEVGLGSAYELLSTYAGRDDELRPWLAGAQLNRDSNMRLQYLAGWGLNFNHPDTIYRSFYEHRKYPAGLFKGSEISMRMMRRLFGAR